MSKKKYPPYHSYPQMTDSHTHLLHMEEKGVDLKELFSQLKERKYSWILDAGVNEENFEERLSYLELYEDLYFSAGIHPENSEGNLQERLKKISQQSDHEKVVAIGEIGLDYYWKDVAPEKQKTFFAAQLELAAEKDLPVIIHNREADQDCLSLLKKHRNPRTGVIHCYSSDKAFAQECLDLGFYLSFAGNVTYKSAENIREAASYTPKDRILVETDAPYLSPQERRGRTNHPGQIGYTLDYLCQLKGEEPLEFTETVKENFRNLFLPSH
ncbi:MAG: TatD family hydrolase [Spirochaetales bacterium]|nr:TatD family hydrolase [Spirochaetales bacterium]